MTGWNPVPFTVVSTFQEPRLCADFHSLVHSVHPLLAAGVGCIAALSDRLAAAFAVSNCRNRRRRCAEAGLGNRDFSSAALEFAGTYLTASDFGLIWLTLQEFQ